MAQSKQKKWLAFIVLTIAAGLIYRVPYLKTVFYDPLVQAFGVTNTEVGTMMSVYSLTKTILYIPAGILVDRFDNRKMLVFSMVMLAVLTFVYALIPSLMVIYILYGLMAVSNVIFWTAFVKAVRMFGSAKEQGSVFGYSEGIRAVASLVINFIALGMYAKLELTSGTPLSGVLYLYGGIYLVMGVAIWFLIPSGTGNEDGHHATFRDYVNVLKVPAVWIVSLLVMCCYSVQVASEYTTPYLSNVMLMSAATAGVVATIRSYGVGLFAAPIIGKITDKVKVPYSTSVIILLALEIVTTAILLILPGDPSVLVVCIIAILAFASFMVRPARRVLCDAGRGGRTSGHDRHRDRHHLGHRLPAGYLHEPAYRRQAGQVPRRGRLQVHFHVHDWFRCGGHRHSGHYQPHRQKERCKGS